MDREKLSCHWLTVTGKRKPWTTDKQQTKDIWVDKHLVAYFPGFKVFQDSLPPFSATQLSLGWKHLQKTGYLGQWAGSDPSIQPWVSPHFIHLWCWWWRWCPDLDSQLCLHLWVNSLTLKSLGDVFTPRFHSPLQQRFPPGASLMSWHWRPHPVACSHASDSFCCSSQKQKELKIHGSYVWHAQINNTGFLERVLVRLEFIRSKKGTLSAWNHLMGVTDVFFMHLKLNFGSVYWYHCSVDADFMATLPLLSTVELLKY